MKKGKIKLAPLYLVVSRINGSKETSTRVFALSRATNKDGFWMYPADCGTKRISDKKLNCVDSSEFKSKSILKVYSVKKNLENNILAVESKLKGKKFSFVPVEQAVEKVAEKKAPVIVVYNDKFQPKDMEDINAVKGMLSGNKNAFTPIYKRYFNQINRYFMSNLRYNQELADDMTMEFFEKIIEKIDKYKPEYTFNSWITAAAKNHLIDYTRKQKTLPGMVSMDKTINSEDNESVTISHFLKDEDAINGEGMIFNVEKKNALNKALLKLDKKSRNVIRLFYIENKSYKEISLEAKIPMHNVKVYLFRAKAELKEIFTTHKALKAAVC